jgi:hypothetical protein
MPCGSPHGLYSIRASPDRRMLASPRSLSQLTAPFVAIPSQAIHHTASLCWMINIPGGCLRLRRGVSPTRWAVVNGPAEQVARRLLAYTAVTSTLSSIAALLNVPLPTCAGKGLVDGTLFLLVIAESHSHTLTGVSPSSPTHSRAIQLREPHANTNHLR